METRKHHLGVLILCTAISLGLMAFSASAAQATTWMLNGSNVEKDLSVGITSTATEGSITLLSTVAGNTLAITCTKLEFRNAVLHAGGIATAEFWWSGCSTRLNGVLAGACKPQEIIKIGEKDESEVKGGKDDDRLEGTTTIDLGKERECAVGEEFELTGIYWIEDTSNEWEVEKLAHTVRESAFVHGLFLGAEPASIDGAIKLEMNDGGAKKFSALF